MCGYGVINFIYKYKKQWDCTRVCDTKQDFDTWIEHEKKVGNKLIYKSKTNVNCYIDY